MPEGFEELVIGGGGNDEPDGSESNPYLVSTIAEIEEAFATCRAKSTAGTYYVKLTANIDGGWKELSTLDYSSNTNDVVIDFDLDNHYIRNFIVNNQIFKMDADIFRNGELYNFYTNSSSDPLWEGIDFINVSASNYIKTLDELAYKYCTFTRSAVWGKVEECNADHYIQFRPYDVLDPNGPYQFEESDSKVLIDNLNNDDFSIFYSGNAIVGRYSRTQGEVETISLSTITNYPAIMSGVSFIDSVINYELPAYSGTVSSGSATTIIDTGTTGVINTSLIHESTYADYTMLNLIEVTDTQMHSATDLNALGFEVYDIS